MSRSSYFVSEDKKRGIQHQKNKHKYKSKSVKNEQYVPPKSKGNLGSNWDRYEKENDVQSFQLNSSTDFSILANAPISQGQHFQFKNDKFIAEETDKTPHDLFSLDVSMLNHSILTVPFYERIGIEENYFSKNQIDIMKKNAEDNLLKYKRKYKTYDKFEQERDNTCNNSESQTLNNVDKSDIVDSLRPPKIATSDNNASESMSELTDKVVDSLKPETKPKSEDDLEQWLDDILDD
ncbi:hypothetical protein NQ315_003864 [Exocentrus adspersus]|uniref:Uncharacterized protein n=1 Tax=Exocentrus adspersus TaxID=1586481 RepID=A0AAV8VZQ6_9CUCU|nr:hypothetical protein NQ315_003864 [Exocentrus adspersus]